MASGKIDYDQFKISDDGRTLFWIVGDKEIRITAKQGGAEFLSLTTLANEYNRIEGHGGTLAVRQYLNLPDYRSKTQYPSKYGRLWKAHKMICQTWGGRVVLNCKI